MLWFIGVTGTMISLMVLAIGFQLSSIYSPPITVMESSPVNSTTPVSDCALYKYVQFILFSTFVNVLAEWFGCSALVLISKVSNLLCEYVTSNTF